EQRSMVVKEPKQLVKNFVPGALGYENRRASYSQTGIKDATFYIGCKDSSTHNLTGKKKYRNQIGKRRYGRGPAIEVLKRTLGILTGKLGVCQKGSLTGLSVGLMNNISSFSTMIRLLLKRLSHSQQEQGGEQKGQRSDLGRFEHVMSFSD
ncbi:MAG: hypothetical protein KDD09_18680, partial [Phaeodactylibacter sp.]|nr:hypothetical protein [Phaeodactylibacter sp.]